MPLYDFIRDFQELIVGAVGFGGVIWTLRSGARQARDQRELEARLAAEQRHQETLDLCRGILTELSQMRANIQHMAKKQFKPDEMKSRVVSPIFATPIFDGNVHHVGRLPGPAVPIVVSAYLQIQRLREFMRSMSIDKEAEHYFQIPITSMGYVQRQCQHVAGRLTEAIDKLLNEVGDHGLPVEDLDWPLTTRPDAAAPE